MLRRSRIRSNSPSEHDIVRVHPSSQNALSNTYIPFLSLFLLRQLESLSVGRLCSRWAHNKSCRELRLPKNCTSCTNSTGRRELFLCTFQGCTYPAPLSLTNSASHFPDLEEEEEAEAEMEVILALQLEKK